MNHDKSEKLKLRLLGCLIALSAFSAFAGNTYYVDAVYGDDGNDGLRPGVGHARKTLAKVMELVTANQNDIVYAAPGRYDERTVAVGTAVYRVSIPDRTALIASGRADETFIVGASANEGKAADKYGNGEGAVRCVKMAANSRLSGFTVTGSRTEAAPTGGTYSGAIAGESNSKIDDCIITDNVAYRGGGGYYSGHFVRCFFKDNVAVNGNGSCLVGGFAYNCVFDNKDGNATYQTTCYNCTFTGQGYGAKEASVYNGIMAVEYDNNVSLYSCVYINSPNRTAKLIDENSVLKVKADIKLDEKYALQAGSAAIDAGSNLLYKTAAGYEHQEQFDFLRGLRMVNGRIDCGAIEFGGGLRGDLAGALNPAGRMRIEKLEGEVTTNGQGAVRMPAGSSMRVFYPYPAGASGKVDFRFCTAVVGSAALTVKRLNAVTPFMTVVESGEFSFSSDVHETLVFEVAGDEGAAVELSGFYNASYVFIDDPEGVLGVEGGTAGINEIIPGGETRTITLTRNTAVPSRCVGVTVNGQYHAFRGEEAEAPLVLELEDGRAPTVVRTVFADRADWYVDDVYGDDGNPGDAPYRARKTLAGAMAIADLRSGDVVHAAPGIYDEGLMPPTSATTNRVVVPAGVGLVADKGPDVTVIEGFIPVTPEGIVPLSTNGGPSSVRCVSMESGAYVKGFTLRNGSTAIDPGKGDRYAGQGGGVYSGTAIDCVISNCYAVRGGAASGSQLIRCRVSNCGYVTGKNAQGGVAKVTADALNGGSIYDTYVTGSAFNLTRIVNSVVLSSTWHTQGGFTPVYNSYIGSDNGQLALTNCYVLGLKTTSILGEGSVSGVNLMAKYIDGATLRPLATSPAIDAGNVEYYVYPAGFAHEAGRDVSGGQRIYNGRIDVGCGEYDWRGAFAQSLDAKGRIEVAEAGGTVSTNASGGLVLSGETALTLDWRLAQPGERLFSVAGEGAGGVTVFVDGEEIVRGEDGVFRFFAGAGAVRVTIRLSGDAAVVVGDFRRGVSGFPIIVR